MKRNDLAPPYRVQLLDNGTPANLTAATVEMHMRLASGGTTLILPVVVEDPPTQGWVRRDWEVGDTAVAGRYLMNWEVTYADGSTQTFPGEGAVEFTLDPDLDTAPPTAPPDLVDVCWPVDESACVGLTGATPEVLARAKAMAGQTLRVLTGYRVGGCPVTVTPCRKRCWPVGSSLFGVSPSFLPLILDGEWVNCGCGSDPCSRPSASLLALPQPVGRVDEVVVDGEPVVDYTVDGNTLVRDAGWPSTPGAISVTYLNAYPVDGLGAYAAGVLACEYAKAVTTGKCRLPAGVTSVARQGVTMEITTETFPSGRTGIREVDSYVQRWNPNGYRAAPRVWSPDIQMVR